MRCRLNSYVASFASGVFSRNRSRGRNRRSEPLREEREQLPSSSASISPSASNAMSPQWQLPEYLVGILDLLLGMPRPRQPGGRPCGDKRAHGGEGERGVVARALGQAREDGKPRSEEHTSELQSSFGISY